MTHGFMMRSPRQLVHLILLFGFGLFALAAAPASKQKTFDSPEAAAEALIHAAEQFDTQALKDILGPSNADLVLTKDAVQDKNTSLGFAAQARAQSQVVRDSADVHMAHLIVGPDAWPVPIPMVETNGKWWFDTAAGREEILLRRIGRNELDAIDVCRGYVEAQQDYASEKHDGATVNQYAQRIISTRGKRDGLAWQNPDGTWGGPVGEGIARVIAQGYSKKTEPYHGYYFKILKGQGPAAPMGQLDFRVKNLMIGGFALVAAPADYRLTGVMTFIVSHNGVVYEKDLGSNTLGQFQAMTRYNPDPTWRPVGNP